MRLQIFFFGVTSLTSLLTSSSSAQPEIKYESMPGFLKLPKHVYLGEVAGVATNSNGHVFVYSRTGAPFLSTGGSRSFVNGGSRLFEFDDGGRFVREIGAGLYGFMFAQALHIDVQGNIWVVDRGSNLVIELNPAGQVMMTLGRKPEAVAEGGRGGRGRGQTSGQVGAGVAGDNFNRPTDVIRDDSGNIFVADGYGNSRIAKFDKSGAFVKSWGSRGAGPGEFDTPHSLAMDSQGQLYVADLGNHRVQVFDEDGNFKHQFTNVGTPWAICISLGPQQFLYVSNSNDPSDRDRGEIYQMNLEGQVLGKFGRAGTLLKEFGTVNQIDCRNSKELYAGELTNWRVQKLTLH